jgi:acyl-CoA thioester hydrolase
VPLTHLRAFRVRHHECDAYGNVRPEVYMRYAQEAAFDASAAAGYSMARYEEIDRLWLARETQIQYFQPLRYGDRIQVKTWVVDFRRVRSLRAYEFHHEATGELVARAFTDWVHLELSTGRPAKISPKMKAAFFPEGPPPPAPPRGRFPDTAPLSDAFVQSRRAEWRDIDPAGHVNNTVYLAYVEECLRQVLAVYGWSQSRLEAQGLALAVKSHRIEYRQPALLDDHLEITTYFSDVEGGSTVWHNLITRPADGAKIARAVTMSAWRDLATGDPVTPPDALAADLLAAIPNNLGTTRG